MELVIKCTKMVLVMEEGELINNLPPGVLEQALRKGKAYRRCERAGVIAKKRIYMERR